MAEPVENPGVAPSRLREGWALLRSLLSYHPRLFLTAVAGAAVFALCTVASSVMLQWVTDHVILPRFESGEVARATVLAGLGGIVAIGFIRAAGVIVRRTWAGRTVWRVAESLSGDVVDRLVAQPVPWHRRQSTGDLVARAGVDVEAATAVLAPMPFASSVVLMVFVSSGWLIAVDTPLGLAATCVFPVLVVLNVVYQRRVDQYFDAAQRELGSLSSAVHESFEGVTVVKAFGAEHRETERLAVIASRLRQARIEAVALRSVFESLLDGLPSIVNIMLVVGGAYRVRSGDMTVGEVTSFVYLFTLLVWPLRLIGYALSELPHSQAGWDRVRATLDDPLVPDPGAELDISEEGAPVVLDGVVARYEADRDVLRGVSATLPAGRTVAVVGHTGAGKTTLLHATAGLIPTAAGRIRLPAGGRAIVFQEPFLLADTLRANVTLGGTYSDEQVLAALDLAEAAFVRELPRGLDTVLGERGVGLSGGQRQRIALARALVRQPAVLLLDDTTSALDPATEAKVLANLREELAGTTVLAVASRPSTIALSDTVLFLVDGTVRADGTHTQLLAEVPEYTELMAAFEHDRAQLDEEPSPDEVAG